MVDRNLLLNNGVIMPALGLGVSRTPPRETARIVADAIARGYRLIDTAAMYGNEAGVGRGLRESGVPRDEVFVSTKLWITDYGYKSALEAFAASLKRLRFEYVDLYLLHWPAPSDFESTIDAYRAAETMVASGRARAIGVCNHRLDHLATLRRRCELPPAVNQVELHPWFNQTTLRRGHSDQNIVTQSWSPLGGVYTANSVDLHSARTPLGEPIVIAMGERHGKTPAQIVIRWHLQNGCSAIPKSVRSDRIAENYDVFDFDLSSGDMAAIDALDTGVRGGPDPEEFDVDYLARLGAA